MFKKKITPVVEPVVTPVAPVADVCVRCGKPATITAPDGKRFCALSCKSASEMN